MIFTVSKLGALLLYPLNLIAALLVAGGVLRFLRLKKSGHVLWGAALVIFLLSGLTPLGTLALHRLENTYARPAVLPDDINGILVLGGAFNTHISATRGALSLNDGAERVVEALSLARRYPQARLVFSGGEGRLSPRGHTESQDMQALVESLGGADHFPPVTYEDRSRTTFENITNTYSLVDPTPGARWVLVTSAYHMPRALLVARHAGWHDIIPWPVDYRTEDHVTLWPYRLDMAGHIGRTTLALHEYLGALAYRLRIKRLSAPDKLH